MELNGELPALYEDDRRIRLFFPRLGKFVFEQIFVISEGEPAFELHFLAGVDIDFTIYHTL